MMTLTTTKMMMWRRRRRGMCVTTHVPMESVGITGQLGGNYVRISVGAQPTVFKL
jgi:hypothetical protein